jgi:hypothetical protein
MLLPALSLSPFTGAPTCVFCASTVLASVTAASAMRSGVANMMKTGGGRTRVAEAYGEGLRERSLTE